MSTFTRFACGLGAGAIIVALAACGESPAGPEAEQLPELEASIEQMAAEANRAGDADAAVAFADGLEAVRFGVRPSEIAVTVGGEEVRYHALVVGVVVNHGDGRELVRRSLIAWAGANRPAALLQVSAFSDEATFGYPADLNTRPDPTGRARGTWADLVRRHRWVATAGTVAIKVASVGDPCPAIPAHPDIQCRVARWDLRLDGTFHQLLRRDARQATTGAALAIGSAAQGISGVVIQRR